MAGVTLPRQLLKTVNFTTAADAMDAGDVVTATMEIEDVFRDAQRPAILDSLMISDASDGTAAAMTLVVLSDNVEVGAIDAAPDITDAEVLASLIGTIAIGSADFVDLGGAKVATLRNIGLVCKGTTTSLYVAVIAAGTPTYGATSGILTAKLGFSPN